MKPSLSATDIHGIHTYLSQEFGGNENLREEPALEAAVKALNDRKFKGILEKAAALMVGIVKENPFFEGNLRTAFFAADVFLRLNGYYLKCDNVVTRRFLTGLFEDNQFTFENLLPWIETNAVKI